MDEASFHRQRRMFAIVDDTLHIADANTPESHTEWFQRMGWIEDQHDQRFEQIVRGFADPTILHVYCGKECRIDSAIEQIFFTHLPTLRQQLALPDNLPVGGGAIRAQIGYRWSTIKSYGPLGDVLKALRASTQN